MSKKRRKRKQNSTKPIQDAPEARQDRRQEVDSDGDAVVEKRAAADSSGKSKSARARRQGPLLAVAVLLLGSALFINWQRSQQNQLPPPVPFPTDELVVTTLAPAGVGAETMFTQLPVSATNVDFTHPVLADHPKAFLYFSSPASGGTAVGDVNGDGRPDLFIASGPKSNRLFLQTDKPFEFEDATEQAGVGGGDAWACGATMVDINADGRLDIFVANYDSPNQLFINFGDGRFREQAAAYGLNITDASLEGVFADYDRDGWLDQYLLTYRYENPEGMPTSPPIVKTGDDRTIRDDMQKYYELTNDSIGYGTVGRTDGLLRNNGDGTFSNVTDESGIYGPGHGQSATWWDFDVDGDVDLHIGNDFNDPDRLYRNNGDGTFTDVIRDSVPHTTWFSMGADAGDLDGDGLPDLLTSDMSSTTHFKQKTTMGSMGNNIEFLTKANPRQYMRNALLLGTGTDRFREAAYLAGLDSTDWTWSVKLSDFDCDGRLDVFFTNGSVRSFTDSDRTLTLSQRRGKTEWDLYKDTQPLEEQNLAFRNRGGLEFDDVSKAWGLDHVGVSMSTATADFDGDGDLDLVVANIDKPIAIYRNDAVGQRRLTIRLHGLLGNRYGVGARVRVVSGEFEQVAELQPSRGFLSSNQPLLHFGCGEFESVDVEVTWPGGGVQRFESVATNSHVEITERASLPREVLGRESTLFVTQNAPELLTHTENDFDDYDLQSLLPHRMSRLGPSIASADVTGDGQFEFFLGGAAGQAGRVVVFRDGTFSAIAQPALDADKALEDMGAVWLDVDQDGDADLVVASGGNESSFEAGDALRLYLNNGKGELTRAVSRLPELDISAGPLAAADFDKDGDVDLFVGGRQVPGRYPLPSNSYLLVNDGGTFAVASPDVCSGMSAMGMATGAIWSDVENDGDLDLLVTTEWNHIRLFRNTDGRLVDDSALAGLSGYRGWWTGISGGDFDNDGDMDFVATNMGTNTKYHASDEHPFQIFYGDFEGNGERKLVEAEYENETLFPVRGKSCSTHAMPSLATKFTTYKDFAAASLQEIYTPQCLDDAYTCSANWLSSSVLLNDGSGRFSIVPLPADAQVSPGFGTVVADLNRDGLLDVFIAQNFYSPQPETGRMDGGLGCLLTGDGRGGFASLAARRSGIVIPDDAMAVVLKDMDKNGVADLIVTTNDGSAKVLVGQEDGTSVARQVEVRFEGVASRSEIAGALVTLEFDGEGRQHFEVHSGAGYLSQQPPSVLVTPPRNASCVLRIVFPNGRQWSQAVDEGMDRIVVPGAGN